MSELFFCLLFLLLKKSCYKKTADGKNDEETVIFPTCNLLIKSLKNCPSLSFSFSCSKKVYR